MSCDLLSGGRAHIVDFRNVAHSAEVEPVGIPVGSDIGISA